MTESTGVMPNVAAAPHATRVQGAGIAVLLFAVGLAIGGGAAVGMAPMPRENPYPSLPKVAEPAVTRDLGNALVNDDERTLATMLDAEMLVALEQALQPIATIFEVRFLGAVERDAETLAGYAVQGRNRSGQDMAVGFVLHVIDGEVRGVN